MFAIMQSAIQSLMDANENISALETDQGSPKKKAECLSPESPPKEGRFDHHQPPWCRWFLRHSNEIELNNKQFTGNELEQVRSDTLTSAFPSSEAANNNVHHEHNHCPDFYHTFYPIALSMKIFGLFPLNFRSCPQWRRVGSFTYSLLVLVLMVVCSMRTIAFHLDTIFYRKEGVKFNDSDLLRTLVQVSLHVIEACIYTLFLFVRCRRIRSYVLLWNDTHKTISKCTPFIERKVPLQMIVFLLVIVLPQSLYVAVCLRNPDYAFVKNMRVVFYPATEENIRDHYIGFALFSVICVTYIFAAAAGPLVMLIFFIRSLESLFRQFKQMMKAALPSGEASLSQLRKDYRALRDLLEETNSIFSPLVFCVLGYNIGYLILALFAITMFDPDTVWHHMVSTIGYMLFKLIILIAVLVYGFKLNEQVSLNNC